MTSPLSRTPTPVATQSPFASPPEMPVMARPASPLGNRSVVTVGVQEILLPVSDEDIDQIGTKNGQMMKTVATKFTDINKQRATSSYGELGDILGHVVLQADRLDPATIINKGLLGWLTNRIYDVKHTVLKRIRTAEESFDAMETKMSGYIAIAETWVNDLDDVYDDNFRVYNQTMLEIQSTQQWIASMERTITNLPVIDPTDPEAIMKTQAYRKAETRLRRLRGKLDGLMRGKTLAELNCPKIMGIQEALRGCATSLREVMVEVIPFVKMDFAIYAAALDGKDSIKAVDLARQLGNETLVRTSDMIADVMVESAASTVAPTITNETMNHMRQKMLGAVVKVREIYSAAETQRQIGWKDVEKSQQAFLTALNAEGAL